MTTHRAKPASAPPATLTIEVAEDEPCWKVLPVAEASRLAGQVADALTAAAIELPAQLVSASLTLSSDAEVRRLNAQWRGIDKATNVLSFPMPQRPAGAPPGPAELGDLIIAEETLAREAAEAGIPVPDHFRHLVLHGLLHLLGYDHETDADAEAMEALETRLLATLSIPDPYADTEPLRTEPSPQQRNGRATAP